MKNEKQSFEHKLHAAGKYAVLGYATLHLILTLGENLVSSVVHLVK